MKLTILVDGQPKTIDVEVTGATVKVDPGKRWPVYRSNDVPPGTYATRQDRPRR